MANLGTGDPRAAGQDGPESDENTRFGAIFGQLKHDVDDDDDAEKTRRRKEKEKEAGQH